MSAQRVQQLVDDLLELWDALPDVITPAQGAPGGEKVAGGGGRAHSPAPIDVGALDAVQRLDRAVVRAAWRVQALLGDHGPLRASYAALRHFPAQYDRLVALNLLGIARNLLDALEAWLRLARRLVGLSVPDRRLGQFCPQHDDVLVELVTPGDQGELVDAQVALDDGLIVKTPAVSWKRVDAVVCRHCGANWSPGKYLALAQALGRADRRRMAAIRSAQAAA